MKKKIISNNKLIILMIICLLGMVVTIEILNLQLNSKNEKVRSMSNSKGGQVHKENKNKELQNKSKESSKKGDEEKEESIKKENLIEYHGNVEHIFFHPLILNNTAAFTGPKWHTDNMDDWFVTLGEFKNILNSLYNKGYVLVDPNTLYEEYTSGNKKLLKKKTLELPKGKKPLIVSIDDLSYNEGMRKATALKLILDKDGSIATYRKDNNGKEIIAHDEIVNIMDEFIKQHPDFSLNGAKGVVAVTGYEGVFGYRSNLDSPIRESEAKKAKVIADKLKENGWKFASHSYGHLDNKEISYEKLKLDADKWEKLVKPVVGDTQIYIYPHGTSVAENSDKFKYLQSKGFKIIYSVDSSSSEIISNNSPVVRAGRLAVDGISMRNRREKFLKFFDSKEVLDLKSRPKRPYKF
ncbi:hypothetical protein ACOAKC_00005 [Hathewaya histolytica]|uniref:hypothetical protein n=1 Tax=Hathewaya histolytica TaxID=1498 RepID=UPI003B67D845